MVPLPLFPFHSLYLQSKATGRILFDQVCKQLSLLEVDYFGLEYQDGNGITVRDSSINDNIICIIRKKAYIIRCQSPKYEKGF